VGVELHERAHAAQRWAARVALGAAGLAVLLPVLFAGAESLLFVAVGGFGIAVALAGVWWVLTRRGVVRIAAAFLAVGAPVCTVWLLSAAQWLWGALLPLALWGIAVWAGTQALVAAVAAEHDIPFLVVSAGTRNHFAMDLGLDRDDPAACLDALGDGVELRVDLGFADRYPFVNNASFGAYAAVVQSPEYRDDKVRTTLELLPELLTRERGPLLTARVGETVIEAPQALLVSNNPYRMDDPAGLGYRERLQRVDVDNDPPHAVIM